ncbi:enoyl-CoA hydratase/isomerase family protein [Paraburkholderia caffeinilytica]|uniref:enoyl-CoA hydratase/isomerase family protein n=1 Tax=Paraburkholderia caffeinilytica TaxID=1761016 RepID=UPI0038B9CC6B
MTGSAGDKKNGLSDSADTIIREDKGPIRVISLNRPDRLNALDPSSIALLRRHLIDFRDSEDARVCIITGTGNRAFCVGADLRETLPPSTSFASAVFAADEESISAGNYIRGLDLDRLNIGKPLIAAINGYAVGGGMELALACDIRIAAESAQFGLTEVKMGSIPAVGGIQRLIRSVPHSIANTMILTGDLVDAATAGRIGLVSEVLAENDLMKRAIELAGRIASNAPLAVKAARLLATQGAEMAIQQALVLEQFVWGVLRDTEDRVEGRRAFAEKRKPVYRGR